MNRDGILNINKPAGMTSFQCANMVRKTVGAKKAGHAGTLDPNAEGVLPVCINKGTKCIEFFMDMGKSYIGKIRFGAATDTMDAWGNVTKTGDTSVITEKKLIEALECFKGEVDQLPPQYSAVKKDGVPLYKLARKGVFTELQPRKIHIYELDLLSYDDEKKEGEIYVHCSKGTYIRVLINDIGEKAGCPANMAALRRMSYGFFRIENSISLDELTDICKNGVIEKYIYPIESLTENYGKVILDEIQFRDFRDGKNVTVDENSIISDKCQRRDILRLYSGSEMVAVVKTEHTEKECRIVPWKFFGKTESED